MKFWQQLPVCFTGKLQRAESSSRTLGAASFFTQSFLLHFSFFLTFLPLSFFQALALTGWFSPWTVGWYIGYSSPLPHWALSSLLGYWALFLGGGEGPQYSKIWWVCTIKGNTWASEKNWSVSSRRRESALGVSVGHSVLLSKLQTVTPRWRAMSLTCGVVTWIHHIKPHA